MSRIIKQREFCKRLEYFFGSLHIWLLRKRNMNFSYKNRFVFTINFFIIENIGNSWPFEIKITPVYLVSKTMSSGVIFNLTGSSIHFSLISSVYFGLKSFIARITFMEIVITLWIFYCYSLELILWGRICHVVITQV